MKGVPMRADLRLLYDHREPKSVASRLRTRRSKQLKTLVSAVLQEKAACQIIDLGGTMHYWQRLGWSPTELERLQITILNVKEFEHAEGNQFRYVVGDATDLRTYGDFSYDICHSNSVIEHVGSWEKKRAFANEVRRIAKRYFIQTPNFWFPIEPHFVSPCFHWLPKPFQVVLTSSFQLGWHAKASCLDEAVTAVESVDLLTHRMMKGLFPDAVIFRERFGFLTKCLVAVGVRPQSQAPANSQVSLDRSFGDQ